MPKAFIINGGHIFGASKGQLNKTISDWTTDYLTSIGYEIRSTDINHAYDEQEELDKLSWADVTIWHVPIWWFQLPHPLKQYIDVVFQNGYGKLFKSDGRSSANPEINYGRGGLLQHKKYMITTSWNAPEGAFTLPGELMKQTSVDDGILFGFHATMEFIGLSRLSGFHFYDVFKNLTPERFDAYQKDYHAHLTETFAHSHLEQQWLAERNT